MLDLSKYDGHTPGPWTQKKQTMFNHPVYICGATRVVADVVAGSGLDELPLGDYETRANADLIADAPLLLDEVRRLREENKTFRAAQKACEDCDAPTVAQVAALRQSHARMLAASKECAVRILPSGPCWCAPNSDPHEWWCVELRAAVAEAEKL